MTQTNGTKMIGPQTERGNLPKSKKALLHNVSAIADVFGDDRGLLKLLLTLTDEELAGVHKFSQGYMNGLFPIDVMIEPGHQI